MEEAVFRREKVVSMKIVAVILARNEAPTVGDIVRTTLPFVDQVVVVDGHSRDETRDVAEKAGARVLLDHGKGKGDGIRTAIDSVDCDILVFMDADGSHDPQDIPRLTGPIVAGEADMVVGSRGRGGSDELHGDFYKLLRMIGSDIILLAINYRFSVRLTDSQNGFRAIRSSAARGLNLKENITTIEQEMTIKCLKKGFRVGEVPSHEYARRQGTSVITLRKVWFRYIWSVIKNIF
jgi:glycosyltransferase involved in cell wall biosynthesis